MSPEFETYFASFPEQTQSSLYEVCSTVKELCRMPALKQTLYKHFFPSKSCLS